MGHYRERYRSSWPGVVNSTFVCRALTTRSVQAGKAHAHVSDLQVTGAGTRSRNARLLASPSSAPETAVRPARGADPCVASLHLQSGVVCAREPVREMRAAR